MNSRQLLLAAQKAAEDKKAEDPVVINLRKTSFVASHFLIVHGTSDRHTRTIASNIIDELAEQDVKAWHVEGMQEGRWILLDFSDLIVHVFHHDTRKFYDLERLWGNVGKSSAPKRKKSSARKR